MLSSDITSMLRQAEAKVLATAGPQGVNVVPVSVITVEDDTIYLYDFFMGKTVENLCDTPTVALTAWSGLAGVQLKAKATYHTSGALFETAVLRMQEEFPTRTLHGVIVLRPTTVYDVSADAAKAGRVLAMSDE